MVAVLSVVKIFFLFSPKTLTISQKSLKDPCQWIIIKKTIFDTFPFQKFTTLFRRTFIFGQKSNFWTKPQILAEIRNLRQKSTIWDKYQIIGQNQHFCEKPNFGSKTWMLTKNSNFIKNLNFRQQLKYWRKFFGARELRCIFQRPTFSKKRLKSIFWQKCW